MGTVGDIQDCIHDSAQRGDLLDEILEKIAEMNTYKDIKNYLFSLRKNVKEEIKNHENALKEFYESDL